MFRNLAITFRLALSTPAKPLKLMATIYCLHIHNADEITKVFRALLSSIKGEKQ